MDYPIRPWEMTNAQKEFHQRKMTEMNVHVDNLKDLLIGLFVELKEEPKPNQMYYPKESFKVINVSTDGKDILVRGKNTIWFQVQLLKIAGT